MLKDWMSTDVLVIGGGGAGFRSAIAAREGGARVLLASKGPLARCGASPMAGADFTLDGNSMNKLGRDGDTNDSMEKVFNDIVTQGFYLNNQRLVEQYVRQAPLLLKDLMDWGLEIKLSDQRMIYASGTHIMDVLLKKARAVGVELMEDLMVLELLVKDGMVNGALCLDIRSGDILPIKCRSAIAASGGWHKAFWPNTGMRDLSGDGMAIAHRAGAPLGNMEFITFCCNVMYEPPMWRGSIAPYMLGLIAGGKLTNNRGEDILTGYDPYMVKVGTSTEWNKSFISHVSFKEFLTGNGFPNGGVHYSRGSAPWDFMKMVASFIFPEWRYKAMDLSEWGRMLEANEPIEVGPAVEYFEGGIAVNERFETVISGLYAAGECCLGAFGSNRVFSAITEMLVQGRDAGEHAAEYAKKARIPEPDAGSIKTIMEKVEAPLSRKGGIMPAPLRREMQERAHRRLGPIRTEKELTEFIGYLDDLKTHKLPGLAVSSKNRAYNKEWLDCIELRNLAHLLEASARSALARRESRGVHFREDFPFTENDNWLKESVVRYAGGGLQIGTRETIITSMSPPRGTMPYFEMMKRMMESHSDTGGKH